MEEKKQFKFYSETQTEQFAADADIYEVLVM